MCDTQYQPDKPIPVQLEGLLHNISTWRDASEIIAAQLPEGAATLLPLVSATNRLDAAHDLMTTAFRLCLAEARAAQAQAAVTRDA